mgnify:CR=1 FL=1
MDNKKEFKPYIPAEKVTPEITVTSIIMGILLAVIFGAANAYLGLKVGMTVSASIPAAVIAMGVIRIIMRRNSILESNVVQTIGSAGESLAAGAIFTLPALFLWAAEGKADKPYKEFLKEFGDYQKQFGSIAFADEKLWTKSRLAMPLGWLKFAREHYTADFVLNAIKELLPKK